MIVLNIKYF